MVLVWIGLILTVAFVIAVRVMAPTIQGAMGEAAVSRRLRRLPDDDYVALRDLLVFTGRGSSQIDHVVVSVYGVFVLETKNYSGWIHGSEHSELWTQSIYRKKTRFRNPVKQNLAHVKALKRALEGVLSDPSEIPYHPIVVFAERATLKNVHVTTPVVYVHEVRRTIRNLSVEQSLTREQVTEIVGALNRASTTDRAARKEHVARVQRAARDARQKRNALICPRCGRALVIRSGRYGTFYGCTGYPDCRYTARTDDL